MTKRHQTFQYSFSPSLKTVFDLKSDFSYFAGASIKLSGITAAKRNIWNNEKLKEANHCKYVFAFCAEAEPNKRKQLPYESRRLGKKATRKGHYFEENVVSYKKRCWEANRLESFRIQDET